VKIVAIAIYYLLLDQGRLVDNRYLQKISITQFLLFPPSNKRIYTFQIDSSLIRKN
jgi:hypothetical protein